MSKYKPHRPGKGMLVNTLALSTNVKRFRKDQGVSRDQLARKTGLTVQTIYNVENAKVSYVRLSTISKIADKLGYSINELMGTGSKVGISLDIAAFSRLVVLSQKYGHYDIERYIMSLK